MNQLYSGKAQHPFGIMKETHYIYLTILIILFLITSTAILSSFAAALEITEIELNPPGIDTNQEWFELYSESSIDLSQYVFTNGDGQKLNLSGIFSSYRLIQLEKQWLDNSNESIKVSGKEQFETPILTDSKNEDTTWQLCNNKWQFLKQTKGLDNGCSQNTSQATSTNLNIIKEQKNNSKNTEPIIILSNNVSQITSTNKEINSNPIILNLPKSKPLEFYSKEYNIRVWVAYGFSIFTLLILALVIKNKL